MGYMLDRLTMSYKKAGYKIIILNDILKENDNFMKVWG